MIGILTYHQALNYGAVLQTYALQTFLQHMLKEVEIIDYRCDKIVHAHTICFDFRNPIGYFYKKRTEKAFFDFRTRSLRTSEACYLANKIDQETYDAFLVGSDQIWNMNISGGDKTFFLDFCKTSKKKFSYAASMGNYRPLEKEEKEIFQYLQEFETISVREKDLQQYLMKQDLQTFVGIDPVLLLAANEWKKISLKRIEEPYILLYMVGFQNQTLEYAQRLRKEKNLSVYWLSDSVRRYKGIKNLRCCKPEEFLHLFANATFVVTNSFHGSAFSILFHRPFCVNINQNGKRNTRVFDLLSQFDLLTDSMEDLQILSEVNWKSVDEKIELLRQDAKKYLQKVGEDCEASHS